MGGIYSESQILNWESFTPIIRDDLGVRLTPSVGAIELNWYVKNGRMAWLNFSQGGSTSQIEFTSAPANLLVDLPEEISNLSNLQGATGLIALNSGFGSFLGVPEALIFQINTGTPPRMQIYRNLFAAFPANTVMALVGQIWFPLA